VSEIPKPPGPVPGMVQRRPTPARRPPDAKEPVRDAVSPRESLNIFLILILVWVWFEFGRPANPLGIPMLISVASLVGWLMRADKRWTTQSGCFVAMVAVMAVGIPMADNSFSAFWTTYGMASILVCICLPLPSVASSARAIRAWIYTFVGVSAYVGGWALFHGGFGPSAAAGGQDENYVAAMMGMAVPFAYFSIFAAKRWVTKAILAGSIAVFCGAMIAADNASRGGFLGLCAVFLYCLARSPRKWLGVVIVTAIVLAILPFAGAKYWDEISTITDVHEGTADVRLEIWTIGMRMWQANPLLGVGAGNFRWKVGAFQSSEQLEKYGRDLGGSIIAHSLFVELLAELGTLGAVVVLIVLWRTGRDLWHVRRSAAGRPGQGTPSAELITLGHYADAVLASMLACLVNGIFLSLLYYSYLWLLIALGSAVTLVFRAKTKALPAG
jgi:O-antigen ligase